MLSFCLIAEFTPWLRAFVEAVVIVGSILLVSDE